MYKIKRIFCAVFRHSMIQTTFFGYYYCGRCGEQQGDTLASCYPSAKHAVIIGHNCEQCRANYKRLSWVDKLLVPNPFKELKEE